MAARRAPPGKPRLLIIDELGSLPFDRPAAHVPCQLVRRRSDRGAIIGAANKRAGEWGDIFADQALAAASLDRLLHHSGTGAIRGESDRLKAKRTAGGCTGAGAHRPDTSPALGTVARSISTPST